ncbi:MAG: hypothetical protein GX258_05190 [Clostridiales bacterium]|nr:hypothetical protein [Clostridiales bacterium]
MKKDSNNYDKAIFSGIYNIISIFLVSVFLISISNTSNNKNVNNIINTEDSLNVGRFITDSTSEVSDENLILSYLKNLYATRNNSFITGNVEDLYRFYDISDNFGAYSLEYEFKRIAFLRDWTNKKDAQIINISSTPKITSLKKGNNVYQLVLTETFSFDYAYNKDLKDIKNFTADLIHNLELEKLNNTFIVTKDYYECCFNSGLEQYNFDLTEKSIPLTDMKNTNL